MNKVIIPVGYMGSGSSAITDLLCEVEGYDSVNGSFEYVLMHCPNGIFDLEDKLLRGNNALRSDEALHSFYDCMKTLFYCKRFGVGDYKHRVSPHFLEECEKYIGELITEKNENCYWYYQETPNKIMIMKKAFNKLIYLISFKTIRSKPVLKYNEMWVAYPSKEEFYTASKRFLNTFFYELKIDKQNLILDQFLLPHNLWRFKNYFDDNSKVIVVDRDPRDVFLLNKYYWKKAGFPLPYSCDVVDFCEHYKKMRQCEIIEKNENILRIHFEDLVYKYDETVKSIFEFLSIEEYQHSMKKTKFIPQKSMKNTQLFNRKSEYKIEGQYIEEHLSEYLYEFPVNECEEFFMNDIIL